MNTIISFQENVILFQSQPTELLTPKEIKNIIVLTTNSIPFPAWFVARVDRN